MPNLLQYVSNENYYARIKVDGKLIRESLKTTVWTTAKLRLVDFQKKHQEARGRIDAPRFSEVVEKFKADLDSTIGLKPQSKQYRLWCLLKIEKSWPKVWKLQIDAIDETACALDRS